MSPPMTIPTIGSTSWGTSVNNNWTSLNSAFSSIGTTTVLGLPLITIASTTGAAGFNIAPGVVPTSPNNGDMWTTASGLYVRINGATVGPLGTGGGSITGSGTSGQVTFWNGASSITSSSTLTFGATSGLALALTAVTSGTQTALSLTGAANTGMTLSTEVNDINLNLNRTVQWATGALTTQRAVLIQAPTYSFVGASTISNAATLAVTGAPAAGTNATLTNAYALWIQAGQSEFDGPVFSTNTLHQQFTTTSTTLFEAMTSIITSTGTLGVGTDMIALYSTMITNPSAAVGASASYFGSVSQVFNSSFQNNTFHANANMTAGYFFAQFGTASTSGSAVMQNLYGVQIQTSVESTNASGSNTVAQVFNIAVVPSTYSTSGGGSLTITNFYGIYLGSVVPSGSLTITNRYGVYQQDSNAINYFGGTILAVGGFADFNVASSSWATTGSSTIAALVLTTLNTNTATIASFTLKMPAAPVAGQMIRVVSAGTVTAFTFSANTGQTIKNAPTTIAAGAAVTYIFSGTTWYRIQ